METSGNGNTVFVISKEHGVFKVETLIKKNYVFNTIAMRIYPDTESGLTRMRMKFEHNNWENIMIIIDGVRQYIHSENEFNEKVVLLNGK